MYTHDARKHYTRSNRFTGVLTLMIAFFTLTLAAPFSQSYADSDSLVVYYSRTGKSEIVAKTIAEYFNSDIVQIKAPAYPEGAAGYMRATIDCTLDRTTTIEPAQVDFSNYSFIILVSPIWGWNISVPMRTLIMQSNFNNKKLVMVTTANIDIKKYAHYKDDASFLNIFFRDYLNRKRMQLMNVALSTKAQLTRHYHIATSGKTGQELKDETLRAILKDLESPKETPQ
jgi:hypothetical protein